MTEVNRLSREARKLREKALHARDEQQKILLLNRAHKLTIKAERLDNKGRY